MCVVGSKLIYQDDNIVIGVDIRGNAVWILQLIIIIEEKTSKLLSTLQIAIATLCKQTKSPMFPWGYLFARR